MASLSLGRYTPYNSLVHRLDPRTKIFCFILLIIPIFLGYSSYTLTFVMAGFSFLLIIVLFLIGHVSFLSFLKSLKSLWFILLFLLLIYAITPRTNHLDWIAFYIGSYPIYWASLLDALQILVRLMMMIALSLILTSTTKPLDLTFGLEWYLTPIRYLGVNTNIWAMIVSLALRFIPTILEDVERIMKAQSSRGVDFKHGKIRNRIRAMVSLIVPLFVSSFVRSEELANAMECRGYDPKAPRTSYRKLKFTWIDLAASLLAVTFTSLSLYLSISGFDPFMSWFGVALR